MNDQSSSAGPSILLRFARWLARTLVDASPENTKKWGQALSSETEAIQEPLDALRWALGGFRLFARAWTSYAVMWLSLPVGASANDTATAFGAGTAPRRSRLFTFVLLAATVTLLLVPQGREAVRTLISCWSFRDSKHDERILQAMAVKAERSQDARTLAFVALARKYSRLDNQETTFSVSKPRLLFKSGDFPMGSPSRTVDISLDGKRFLVAKLGDRKAQPVTELILVQNWLEEVKRLAPTGKQ